VDDGVSLSKYAIVLGEWVVNKMPQTAQNQNVRDGWYKNACWYLSSAVQQMED